MKRTMATLCKNVTLMKAGKSCVGVSVLPHSTFAPKSWQKASECFSEYEELPDFQGSFKGSVKGLHVWNKVSIEWASDSKGFTGKTSHC